MFRLRRVSPASPTRLPWIDHLRTAAIGPSHGVKAKPWGQAFHLSLQFLPEEIE